MGRKCRPEVARLAGDRREVAHLAEEAEEAHLVEEAEAVHPVQHVGRSGV
jgi:hypothetical protein